MTHPNPGPVPVAELPPISPVLGRLSELTTVDEQAFERIVQIVTTDPALTARVLAVANSSFFGLTYRVRTIQEAAIVIGTHGLSQIALGLIVGGAFRSLGSRSTSHVQLLWRHSVAVGVAAESIARRCGHPTPNEAFVAGLMHDIGKLVWMHTNSEIYTGLLDAEDGSTLLARERRVLGSDHAQIGWWACQEWGIPESIGRAIVDHHAVGDHEDGVVVSAVKVADQIAKLAGLGASLKVFADMSALGALENRGIGEAVLFEVMRGLATHVADVERLFNGFHDDGHCEANESGSLGLVRINMKSPCYEELIALLVRNLGYEAATGPLDADTGPSVVISDQGTDDGTNVHAPPSDLLVDLVPIDELRDWLVARLSEHDTRLSV